MGRLDLWQLYLIAICVRGSIPAAWLSCGSHFVQSHLTKYEGVGAFLLNLDGTFIVNRLTSFLSLLENLPKKDKEFTRLSLPWMLLFSKWKTLFLFSQFQFYSLKKWTIFKKRFQKRRLNFSYLHALILKKLSSLLTEKYNWNCFLPSSSLHT